MRTQSKIAIRAVALVICFATACTNGDKRPWIIPTPFPPNTPVPTVIEPGLAYGVPCKPPCWRGLIPGESDCYEVERAIEKLRADEWAYYIDGSCALGGYSISPSPFGGRVDVTMENDIVTKIHSSTLLFYYPVGALVEQFGGPEGVWLLRGGSCSSCEEWEHPDPLDAPVHASSAHLLYPEQGLWFLMLVPTGGTGCICPEMKVVSFCYYAPVSVQEALTDNYLADLCSSSLKGVTRDELVEWHGFGCGY